MKLNVKYRTWYRGVPPRRIRLELPGWAGEKDAADAQPFFCKPWLDGTTYGLELVYPFETECRVRAENGECQFFGDFSAEKLKYPTKFDGWEVPFSSFAPGTFGMTSSLDIKTDPGYGVMILPHPRYYVDRSGTVPLPVMGFIESDMWPKIFFVAFTAPLDGQEHVFRQGEPYATVLILPKNPRYDIQKMTPEEEVERATLDAALAKNGRAIATKRFIDSKGQPFDNKYKVLSSIAREKGVEAAQQKMVCPMRGRKPKVGRKVLWKKPGPAVDTGDEVIPPENP